MKKLILLLIIPFLCFGQRVLTPANLPGFMYHYTFQVINSDTIFIEMADIDTASIDTVFIQFADIDTMTADTIYIKFAEIDTISTDTLFAKIAELDTAIIDTLFSKFAELDTANIDTAFIRFANIDTIVVDTLLTAKRIEADTVIADYVVVCGTNFTYARGEILTNDETPTGTTCTTAGTWYQYTVDIDSTHSEDASDSVTFDYANSDLEIKEGFDGSYLIIVSSAVSVDATSEVHIGIAKNGTVGDFGVMHYDVKTANDEIPLSTHKIARLVAGDKITIMYKTDSDGDIVSTYHLVLTIMKIN